MILTDENDNDELNSFNSDVKKSSLKKKKKSIEIASNKKE